MTKTFSSFYRWYMNSKTWKARRQKILKRDGHKCAYCGSRKHLEVHHIYYENLGNEKPEDLITLCRMCHKEYHRRKELREKQKHIKQARKRKRKGRR